MSWWSTAFTRLIFWVDWAPIRSGPAASPLPVGEHRRHLAIQRRDRTPGADCPVELACGLGDRTSVVSGKSVSVRVDLGGRRIIKKKNHPNPVSSTHVKHRVYTNIEHM